MDAMVTRMKPMLLSFALLSPALAVGCFPKAADAPPPLSPEGVTWSSTRWPGTNASSLASGREHFVAKCNGCHGYPDLASITEDRWPAIVERMANKAGLAAEQREAVLRFVLASRSERTGHR
jgi:hypothetical protein